jgi:hypothetical protein
MRSKLWFAMLVTSLASTVQAKDFQVQNREQTKEGQTFTYRSVDASVVGLKGMVELKLINMPDGKYLYDTRMQTDAAKELNRSICASAGRLPAATEGIVIVGGEKTIPLFCGGPDHSTKAPQVDSRVTPNVAPQSLPGDEWDYRPVLDLFYGASAPAGSWNYVEAAAGVDFSTPSGGTLTVQFSAAIPGCWGWSSATGSVGRPTASAYTSALCYMNPGLANTGGRGVNASATSEHQTTSRFGVIYIY